jgi:hypothetical protein
MRHVTRGARVTYLGAVWVQVRVGQESIARVAVVCGWVLLPVMAVVAGLAVALLFLWAYSSRFVFV